MPLTNILHATRILIIAGFLIACEGRSRTEPLEAARQEGGAASVGEAFLLVPMGAYVAIEASRKDTGNMRENDPECFIWPKTCESQATTFVEMAGGREPLEALQLDAGVYDITLSYGASGSAEVSQWRGRTPDVRVDAAGIVVEVVTVSPDSRESASFLVRLQAQVDLRPDGPICASVDRQGNVTCTPEDPRYRCSQGGMVAYGCSKSALYVELKNQLCQNKQQMMESQFAAGFACSEIADADLSQPL